MDDEYKCSIVDIKNTDPAKSSKLLKFQQTKIKLMTDFESYKKYVDEHGIDMQIIYIYACGFCDIFSMYLHEKLNYNLSYSSGMLGGTKVPVHSFCVYEDEYFDINGKHTNVSILENPYWNSLTVEGTIDVNEHNRIWKGPDDHFENHKKFVEYIYDSWLKRVENNIKKIKLTEFVDG